MSELVENLSKIAGNLNKVDFAGLSQELKSLLATVNQQAGGLDLKKMVAAVTSAASSIDALAGSAEAKAAFANLNQTAMDVQGLVAKLDTQVEPVSANSCAGRRFNHFASSIADHVLIQFGDDGDQRLPGIGIVVNPDGRHAAHPDSPQLHRAAHVQSLHGLIE